MEDYLDTATKTSTYSSKRDLIFYLNNLFGNQNFHNKTMLDIGGGNGIFSFYAACKGTNLSVVLEPLFEGSDKKTEDTFIKIKQSLFNSKEVKLIRKTFQEYQPKDLKFDIILLHYSINHLDEDACIHLASDEKAQENYRKIFNKLFKISKPGTKLIITDCSNRNFFADLKIKNPFAPTIEWEKHQPPEVWLKLLESSGFREPKIKWLSFRQLRKFGKLFIGNRFMSYFLNSHFLLEMTRT